jgi:hypothetical protein
MGHVYLESHYKVDPLLELDNFKDIMDDSSGNVDFQNHKSRRTFLVLLTTKSFSKDPNLCFLIDWKSVLSNLLLMKVIFKTIVYICDQFFL